MSFGLQSPSDKVTKLTGPRVESITSYLTIAGNKAVLREISQPLCLGKHGKEGKEIKRAGNCSCLEPDHVIHEAYLHPMAHA